MTISVGAAGARSLPPPSIDPSKAEDLNKQFATRSFTSTLLETLQIIERELRETDANGELKIAYKDGKDGKKRLEITASYDLDPEEWVKLLVKRYAEQNPGVALEKEEGPSSSHSPAT